jgi:hypothetical protein
MKSSRDWEFFFGSFASKHRIHIRLTKADGSSSLLLATKKAPVGAFFYLVEHGLCDMSQGEDDPLFMPVVITVFMPFTKCCACINAAIQTVIDKH